MGSAYKIRTHPKPRLRNTVSKKLEHASSSQSLDFFSILKFFFILFYHELFFEEGKGEVILITDMVMLFVYDVISWLAEHV